MPVHHVIGDPLLTSAQTLAFGFNAAGRTEVDPFTTLLMTRYPAAFATFTKKDHTPGSYWLWRETKPYLMFMVVRQTGVGTMRLRFVESAVMSLARDYKLESLKSVAIAPLGVEPEWSIVKPLIDQWFGKSALPVVVYDHYRAGTRAEETLLV